MDTRHNRGHSLSGGDNGSPGPKTVPPSSGRKRTRRACDRCSSLRVRCDGNQPCRRCEEYNQSCHYARSIGKRGRKPNSRKATHLPSSSRAIRPQRIDNDTQEGNGDSSEADCELEQSTPHPQPPQRQPGTSQDIINYEAIAAPQSITDADEITSPLYPSSVPQATTGRITDNPNSFSSRTHATPPQLLAGTATTSSSRHAYHVSGSQAASHTLPDFEPTIAPISNVTTAPRDPRLSLSSAHGHSHAQERALWPTTTTSQTAAQCPTTNIPNGCRYKCLEPIVPMLQGIIDAELMCELFELYFVEPGGSLFRCSSPYVLAHVVRKESLLRAVDPRKCTPALLVTMLWVSAQTAESSLFLLPGQKSRVCEELRSLMMVLIQDRDYDLWSRTTDGALVKDFKFPTSATTTSSGLHRTNLHQYEHQSLSTAEFPPVPLVDDVLMFVLVTIVVSGGDFKTDCHRWWNKALRLSNDMGLNREDTSEDNPSAAEAIICTGGSANSPCGCRPCEAARTGLTIPEIQEERRRVFWLIFCLDRHLALSYNAPLRILDDECQLYAPLSDQAWESLSLLEHPAAASDSTRVVDESQQQQRSGGRMFGAPTKVIGTGFFEYFLPLMTILGDVIQLHRQKSHPRFGNMRRPRNSTSGDIEGNQQHDDQDEDDPATNMIEQVMEECAQSIADLASLYQVDALDSAAIPASQVRTPNSVISSQYDETFLPTNNVPDHNHNSHHRVNTTYHDRQAPSHRQHAQAQLVTAYSTFILHVLHVLLHGKWDAVSMLDNTDGWIPSVGFMKCASHAIAASDAMSRILACDPELSFMPYLFGIYLLHGSFILLLFADRMPQLGLNESVEKACEIIIRAHEVCVVTLSTEFQKRFRKVLRSTLYSVRSPGTSNVEESKARRRALSLYRWNNGSTGLAL